MKLKKLLPFLVTLSLVWPFSSFAIDIDIYSGGLNNGSRVAKMMFFLDNTANWTSVMEQSGGEKTLKAHVEHEALYTFLHEVRKLVIADPSVKVEMGIMLYADGSIDGGRVQANLKLIDGSETGLKNIIELQSMLYCVDGNSACLEAIRGQSTGTYLSFSELKAKMDDIGYNLKESYALPKSNNAAYAYGLYEAYLYYTGRKPNAGLQDGLHDTDAINDQGTATELDDTYFPQFVPPAGAPADAEYCGKNQLIYIANGKPSRNEDSKFDDTLAKLQGVATPELFQLTPQAYDALEGNWMDEMASHMAKRDVDGNADNGIQTINTHVVNVIPPFTNGDWDPNVPETYEKLMDKAEREGHVLLYSAAVNGGGGYYLATDVDQLVTSLLELLAELIDVSDVFAASALPVSVNVRGTNLNQVYIGVFRPDGQKRPRWMGNMKMYKLGVDSLGNVILSDADGKSAAGSRGFIDPSARSFWTFNSTFWDFDADIDNGENDNPDGDLVEKGGAAQQLRDEILNGGGRNVYTCGTCSTGEDLTDSSNRFNDSNSNIGISGLTTGSDEWKRLINWVRGDNVHEITDETIEYDQGSSSAVRPSIHGDVLHSRPAVVNYGDTDNDGDEDVFVFYGANDGTFHAIRGGTEGEILEEDLVLNDGTVLPKDTEITNEDHGEELWSFIAPEHYDDLKTLYDNEVLASPKTLADKPFFFDGAVGQYVRAERDPTTKNIVAEEVIIYLTARRGGNMIYALDVSDPYVPKLKWKKNGSDIGYEELDQTWSAPTVTKVKADFNGDGVVNGKDGHTGIETESADRTVLIIGKGYNAAANDGQTVQLPLALGARSAGVMMIDAFNGDVLWQAGWNAAKGTGNDEYYYNGYMQYSVPGDITVIDRDRDGYADRLYFGDTGGQLWRGDIHSKDLGDWQATRMFYSGVLAGPDGKSYIPKFLSAPDVAASTDPDDPFDAVVVTSGDRENPFETDIVDYIFVIKDRRQAAYTYADPLTLATVGAIANATKSADLTTDPSEMSKVGKGYYIELAPGEKGISKATIVNSIVFLNTFTPAEAWDCEGLGEARTYQFDFMTSGAVANLDGVGEDTNLTDSDRSVLVEGGGLIPDPVPVLVTIDGKVYEAIIAGTQVQNFENTQLERRFQTFWYKDIDD